MIPPVRRALNRGAAPILALGLLAAAACSGGSDESAQTGGSAGPSDQVTYLTAFGEFGREGYAHVADAKGFFAEQGIEVTIEPGGPGNEEAVSAGTADFAATDSSGAFRRYQGGVDGFQIISAVQQSTPMGLMTLESYSIAAAPDLAGMTVGCAEGSIIGDLFAPYARELGLDPDAVTFEPVQPPQIPGALASRQIDAACLFATARPGVEAAGGEPAVVLAYDEVLSSLYGAVNIANATLVEDNPDLVRRFNTAIAQGLEYATENPTEAGEILTEYVPETNPEVASAELEILGSYHRAGLAPDEPTGMMIRSRVGGAVTFLQGNSLLRAPSTYLVDEVVAWDLIPGADEYDLERQ